MKWIIALKHLQLKTSWLHFYMLLSDMHSEIFTMDEAALKYFLKIWGERWNMIGKILITIEARVFVILIICAWIIKTKNTSAKKYFMLIFSNGMRLEMLVLNIKGLAFKAEFFLKIPFGIF